MDFQCYTQLTLVQKSSPSTFKLEYCKNLISTNHPCTLYGLCEVYVKGLRVQAAYHHLSIKETTPALNLHYKDKQCDI